ncbi:MAG: hypothetical protein ACAI44_29475 [Candidatus Sericytochromatia bacterium]
MMKHPYILAASLSLLLAACALTPGQFSGPQPLLLAEQQIDVEPYRSLVIKDDGFETKGTITSAKRAVIATVGTTDYTLTYKFMNKLRGLIMSSPYYANNGLDAVALAGFFTRLKASATTNVSANSTTGEPAWGPTAGTPTQYLYTLSASESAFVDKMGSYSTVLMPNYLVNSEGATEGSDSYNALQGQVGIRLIVNKTGVRTSFYKAVHYAMGAGNDAYSADFETGYSDHVLYGNYLINVTGAPAFSYSVPSGTSPAVRTVGSLYTMVGATTADKTFLASLEKAGPYVQDVLLLNNGGYVSLGNISLRYGDYDQIAPTATGTTSSDAEKLLANLGVTNRVNSTWDLSSDSSKFVEPGTSANYTSVGAFLGGLIRSQPTNWPTELEDLNVATADKADGPSAAELMDTGNSEVFSQVEFGDMHRALRMLHQVAGDATTTTAPTNLPKFGAIMAPTAAATPTVAQITSTTELGQLGDLVFTQLSYPVYKIGKTTATTLRNKSGIEDFFTTSPDARFLLVPASRSSTGALTFSSTGTNWVAVFATYSGNFSYYIYDPSFANLSGNGFYSVTDVNPALATALYNYAGTLIGVDAT